VISVFYYLRVTVAMYMSDEPAGGPVEVSWAAPGAIALLATLALTLWWGIQAQALLVTAHESVRGLL
jgi:NADH:ubiquinone oxidoreductase subunit 2 (subunit N)